MKVVVRSDTHSPRRWKGLPDRVAEHLEGADAILHAGDVCTADVLEELTQWAPVHAVLGNNDLPEVADWGAPETLELELTGLQVAMIHDSGPRGGREGRMRRRRDPNAESGPLPHRLETRLKFINRRLADLRGGASHQV